MKEVEYNFTCDWDWEKPIATFDEEHYRITHLDTACNGNHLIKIDDIFYSMLIHRLEIGYKLSIDEKFIDDLINDFEIYFENKIKSFENGDWNVNHFHSIDIYAEIIIDYCELKYSNQKV